jgi:hypothetical protein
MSQSLVEEMSLLTHYYFKHFIFWSNISPPAGELSQQHQPRALSASCFIFLFVWLIFGPEYEAEMVFQNVG